MLESLLTHLCYCKSFSKFCFPKETSGFSLEWMSACKDRLCLLRVLRPGIGPISDAGEGRLTKLWGPLETLASNVLFWQGKPNQLCCALGGEKAVSRILFLGGFCRTRTYFWALSKGVVLNGEALEGCQAQTLPSGWGGVLLHLWFPAPICGLVRGHHHIK